MFEILLSPITGCYTGLPCCKLSSCCQKQRVKFGAKSALDDWSISTDCVVMWSGTKLFRKLRMYNMRACTFIVSLYSLAWKQCKHATGVQARFNRVFRNVHCWLWFLHSSCMRLSKLCMGRKTCFFGRKPKNRVSLFFLENWLFGKIHKSTKIKTMKICHSSREKIFKKSWKSGKSLESLNLSCIFWNRNELHLVLNCLNISTGLHYTLFYKEPTHIEGRKN